MKNSTLSDVFEKSKKLLKRLFSNKKRAIGIIAIIVVSSIVLVNRSKNNKDEVVTQTYEVAKGTIISSITASGSIVPSNIENVTTQASGTVKKVYVSDGDTVYVGQKLAEIDLDVQGQQNYASSYSNYISAANSLNSANNSYELSQASLAVVYDEIKGHDSDETFEMKEDRIRAENTNENAYDSIKTAQARLSSASLSLKTSSPVITAPTSGVVKSVTIAEGMNIGASETASGSRANQRVATIETGGLPIASFNVSEIDVLLIKPGQKATITLDSIEDKTFTGSVVSVDRVGSTSNNVTTYPVIIQLDTESEEILPNMAATANIIVETKSDVLVIPSSAISYSDDQAFVTTILDKNEQVKNIEVGISNDTETEVVSGISEGDVIVISTQANITSQDSGPGGGLFPGGGGGGVRISR